MLDMGELGDFLLAGFFVVPSRLGLVLPEEDSLLICLFIFFAMSPTLEIALAALLIDVLLGVVEVESTS